MSEHLDNNGFSETVEINGHEVLITEHIVAVHAYDTPFSRYDHLLINPDGEVPIAYFPPERAEFLKWLGRVDPVVKAKPEDHVREVFWEIHGNDPELTDEDVTERERVAQAKADRELTAMGDFDSVFASLLKST